MDFLLIMDEVNGTKDLTLRELVQLHAKEQYVDSTLKILHENMIDNVETLVKVLPADVNNTMHLPFALVVDLRAYVEKQLEVKRQLLHAEEKDETERKHTIVESEAVRKAREFFRTVDTDNNGSLDVEEFRVLMAKLGETDMEDVAKIHKKLDLNKGTPSLLSILFHFNLPFCLFTIYLLIFVILLYLLFSNIYFFSCHVWLLLTPRWPDHVRRVYVLVDA
jgi:hypothetical protein